MKLHKAIERLDANDANLSGSVFENVNLAGARFHDVRLSGVIVENADMAGAQISDVNLTGASIKSGHTDGMTINGIAVADLFAAYRTANSEPSTA